MNRTYPTIAFPLAVILAAATIAGCGQNQSKKELRYETVQVERGPLIARVSASGTLSALVTVQVGSQVSGRILTLSADFNSRVRRGQVLATLDPALFKAALAISRANVAAAEANLGQAMVQAEYNRRQYLRQKELAASGIVNRADLETAEAAAETSQAQVKAAQGVREQARAALSQAEINLSYTTIISPINGVVISRNVDIGQTVAASLQAPTLFVIAEDLRKMQVDTSIAEADVGRLKDGMEATFTVDAYPGAPFKGVIRQVRNNATTVQNVVTYNAVIDVRNPDLKLRPGMTANVSVVVGQRQDVRTIANAALRFRPPAALLAGRNAANGSDGAAAKGGAGAPRPSAERGDRRTLWVLKDRQVQPVPVQIGLTDGTRTEIVRGDLKEGDAVVTDVTGLTAAPSGFRAL
ncbi:MAG: efflux RND transporter periplasmic adaptor subunit [Candidatus Lambdaproteobacteria bacterium]|nr:efflux RND transporter periplasmic adaptor subunit [Candidatus Lambdaproteobacteria bacterium]